MSNRNSSAGQSGSFNPLAIFVTAIAILAATGASFGLAPTAATREFSAAAAYAGPAGYFPDQFVNQAKEIEALPPTF